jgi:flagellar biosynthetic protein FliQ
VVRSSDVFPLPQDAGADWERNPDMESYGLDLVRQTLMITLMISAPILVAGILVGLVISIAQAVTQIQEQTLSFVPKIAAMILVAIALLGWIATQLVDFAVTMFEG